MSFSSLLWSRFRIFGASPAQLGLDLQSGVRILPTSCALFHLHPLNDRLFIDSHKYGRLDSIWEREDLVIFVQVLNKSSPRLICGTTQQKFKVHDQWGYSLYLYFGGDYLSLGKLISKVRTLKFTSRVESNDGGPQGDLLILKSFGRSVQPEFHICWSDTTVGFVLDMNGLVESEKEEFFARVKFEIPVPKPQQLFRRTILSDVKKSSKNVAFFVSCQEVGVNVRTPQRRSVRVLTRLRCQLNTPRVVWIAGFLCAMMRAINAIMSLAGEKSAEMLPKRKRVRPSADSQVL